MGWQMGAAFLAASILISFFHPTGVMSFTPAKVLLPRAPRIVLLKVTWEPSNPVAGQNVTLIPGGLEVFHVCRWYRAAAVDEANEIFSYHPPPPSHWQQKGSAYTGRETGGPGCTLHITNLTLDDSGNYTVTKESRAMPLNIGHALLRVSEPPSVPDSACSKRSGIISGIVLGSLVVTAMIGILLYFLLRAYYPSDNKTSTQLISTYAMYEHLSPSVGENP
ncbi:carcinoembryonic antigen-related cell adhesion molecule 4-like [Eublepharis macularius]|uniref:Carcinoembryonic antigen-related cell adhesion molecule 4-like n=1 Tax=Eublepharis macularius TaxID=481883 RepID=A0AA97KD77_EUBMA|nr:carcinoembryonic antigen-related cell adhesion molecule 4-like [Eublepharis macularius]